MRGAMQLNPVWTWGGGTHFQQIWSYYHNLSFHSLWPPILEYINTFFFHFMKPWAWQAPKAIPRAAFHSSLAYFWTLFGEDEGPHGAVWEHITRSFCVMHICLNSAPLPARMTSSSTDHHKLTVGASPFIAYNFTALSCKHCSVPLL